MARTHPTSTSTAPTTSTRTATTAVAPGRLGLDELTMLRGTLVAMRTEAVERASPGTASATGAVTDTSADPAYEALLSDSVARAQALVVDIDDALRRMNEGSYGLCQSCGEEIALERLEAIPQTRTCVRCPNQRPRLLG
jgi:RNA polymerase-binding transcription factor DksA